MKVGIVGLPSCGKSSLFNALTHGQAETGRFGSGRAEVNRGRVLVPDDRLDWLTELYSPKKKTPASVDFLDAPGLAAGSTDKATAAELWAVTEYVLSLSRSQRAARAEAAAALAKE